MILFLLRILIPAKDSSLKGNYEPSADDHLEVFIRAKFPSDSSETAERDVGRVNRVISPLKMSGCERVRREDGGGGGENTCSHAKSHSAASSLPSRCVVQGDNGERTATGERKRAREKRAARYNAGEAGKFSDFRGMRHARSSPLAGNLSKPACARALLECP